MKDVKDALSVIMPAYNEEMTIRRAVKQVAEHDSVGELIVVDDGSTDKTWQILNSISDPKIKKIRGESNRGKGWAVRRGFLETSFEIVAIQDADLESGPDDYLLMMMPILSGKAKVVYGNRLNARHFIQHPAHFTGNKFLTFLINMLNKTEIRDVSTTLRIFKREVLEGLEFSAEGFDFDIELTLKMIRKGLYIESVNVAYFPRTYRDGKKLSWADRYRLLKAVFAFM